ncbi:RNA polymerase sigma factor [Microbacterium sp. NPDC058269]|uniref:RNA polymerase sigma factor n=1 Tax=Microbacterium sp. NPDC058269 TaxID=3346414 RepID=UPI0036D906B7
MGELTGEGGIAQGNAHAEQDALVCAAANGDRRAAGMYYAQNLSQLSMIARKIAGDSYDPDDLLGEALLIVLSRWAEGSGPTGNVNAYIAKVMRNKLLDEVKSPRSKVRHFAPTDDPAAPTDDRIRRIDHSAELALVRRALLLLPPDQQEVLTATVIEGRKPGELETQLARPVSAIYALTRRAKANLRRTMLRLLLEENARQDCAAAAKRLPEVIGDSPDTTRGGGSADHYQSCRRCRRVWARFAALATLGITPLVLLSDLISTPPASAAVEKQEIHSDSSRTPASQPLSGRRLFGRLTNIVGLAVGSVGIVLASIVAIAFVTKTFWFEVEPVAQIGVTTSLESSTQVDFKLDFEVADETWQTKSLTITLTERVDRIRPPAGWRCDITGTVVTCTTDALNAGGGTFSVDHQPADTPPRYWIKLTTITDTGVGVIGTAASRVQP